MDRSRPRLLRLEQIHRILLIFPEKDPVGKTVGPVGAGEERRAYAVDLPEADALTLPGGARGSGVENPLPIKNVQRPLQPGKFAVETVVVRGGDQIESV